ncbi:MAG: DUF4856 domain-containing protein [Myxococcota bacterium]
MSLGSNSKVAAAIVLALAAAGCGDDGNGSGDLVVPETYAFESAFEPGESSVSYSGQTMRHVLIHDLNDYIAGLDSAIPGSFSPSEDGEVVTELDAYFRFNDSVSGGQTIRLSTTPDPRQMTYDDVGTGKDLVGKLAGNDGDPSTYHRDFSEEFAGWSDASIADQGGGIDTPEGLVVAFFESLEELAIAQVGGARTDGQGEPIPVYVTDEGQDLKQLIQKFLLGAITFSQGADDYLDDDVEGKGLLADNVEQDDGAPYTSLEHQWDEGFGYFGAARDYGDYTDDEIAGAGGRDGWASGYHDTDGDGAIDLESEYNFGHSQNAGKRDRGAVVETDLTGQAFEAFVTGRAIINHAAGRELTDEELADLREQRDLALDAWEKAVAATVVHYINDTLEAMDAIGTDDYAFANHAKVWSELKGFALGFQFSPHSPLSQEDFETLHTLLRDAPVLEEDGEEALSTYRDDLLDARDLLESAYGFDPTNVADW